MPRMLMISSANQIFLILFLFVFGGCSGATNTLTGFVPGSIVDSRANAEIRQAAIEDDSFPSASEAPAQK